ncbi:MAG: DUF1801 domain-containing protein [Sphingomicrobium sp.]
MSENKTRPSSESVEAFLDKIPDADRRDGARTLCRLMQRVTGEEPVLWGGSMIGFGRYRYKYESGREGEWLATGFAPRAKELVVYLMADSPDREQLLARLGKHRVGKSCLYIKQLADIDLEVLEALIRSSLQALSELYPVT